MRSEPYKIKEVKKMTALRPYERWNILKQAHFNTFHVCSDHVAFDMVARGMSAWSHFQKAGLMIGDEAYAGARSFLRLESAVADVLGIEHLVPTHNGIGSEKLLVATMLQPGQTVLHNRGRCEGLVPANKGKSVDVSIEGGGQVWRAAEVRREHRPREAGAAAEEAGEGGGGLHPDRHLSRCLERAAGVDGQHRGGEGAGERLLRAAGDRHLGRSGERLLDQEGGIPEARA